MSKVTTKERDVSVDSVKGLAITAVVFGHLCFSLPSIPERNIYLSVILSSLWHVPVFFCIAGFFIKDEKLLHPCEFILKKVKTLYLKTILFVGGAVLLHNLLIRMGFYSTQVDYYGKAMFFYSTKDMLLTLIKTIFLMGREPITGPLWFAHVLFLALCGYSLLSYLLSKLSQQDQTKMFAIRGVTLLAMTILSNILTQNFGITQNRLSNVFPAMLLIYIGQFFNERRKMKYDSPLIAFVCLLLFVSAALRSGGISLNNNQFYDLFHLICGGGAATYLLLFCIKKVKFRCLKRGLAFLGNYSFAIMGLHFFCFKLCIIIWNSLFGASFDVAALLPGIGKNYMAGIFFLLFSCIIPAMLGLIIDKFFLKKISSFRSFYK